MKGEIPKPLIAVAIVLVVAVAGFFFWSATKPLATEKPLQDATTMTQEDIAKIKQMEHAPDEARARAKR